IAFEYVISAKWLELLKDISPELKRVAVLRDAAIATGIGQLAVIQAAASSFGVEVRPVSVRDADEIERAVTAFARSSHGGLIVTASVLMTAYRKLIIALAARDRHSIGKHGGGGKPQLDLKPIKSPHPAKKGIALTAANGSSHIIGRRARLCI